MLTCVISLAFAAHGRASQRLLTRASRRACQDYPSIDFSAIEPNECDELGLPSGAAGDETVDSLLDRGHGFFSWLVATRHAALNLSAAHDPPAAAHAMAD
eukprot:SAG31_NODE_23949_length_492_cov_1.117048_2_plen_99_part_01